MVFVKNIDFLKIGMHAKNTATLTILAVGMTSRFCFASSGSHYG